MARTYKDLTREDCEQFRREHPEMTRQYLYQHHSTYARAMKRLGIFDELWPSLQRPWTELTVEDCERFRREHPEMRRDELRTYHYSYLIAMQRLGIFDELYPRRKDRPDMLTLEQCEAFQREHPGLTREEMRMHHTAYMKAMKQLGVYDTLYPLKHQSYSDEYLIERASLYKNQRDMLNSEPKILRAICARGKEFKDVALKHMKRLGNMKWKMIYAYEFPDGTAYVGLTYDKERRQKDHLREEGSAVRRHREQTGLEPVYRQLTGLMPVEDAQRMEGEWKERYEKDGWTMLNIRPTGGIGGSQLKVDEQRVIDLFKQGVPSKLIPKYVNCYHTTVSKILKRAGLSYRGMSNVPIEVLDDDGLVIETFPSIKDAADAWGMHPANVRKNMRNGWRTRGHYLRHNAEVYRVKYGKEPPEWEGIPKEKGC